MVTAEDWITDWGKLDPSKRYIVFPVNVRDDRTQYLGQPGTTDGWFIRNNYRQGCYVALPVPPFEGLETLK